jgi:hypothetical protein
MCAVLHPHPLYNFMALCLAPTGQYAFTYVILLQYLKDKNFIANDNLVKVLDIYIFQLRVYHAVSISR